MIGAAHKEYFEKIAYNLFRIRSEKKLTQEHLYFLCNVERSKISRIEHAKEDFILSTILNLATALEVDLKELLDFTVTIPQKFRKSHLTPKKKKK
jgi:transcriptional regulator with XRE-family HTH domain